MSKGTLHTSHTRFIVVDEADTVLDSGNIELIAYLMRRVRVPYANQQYSTRGVFVSATLNGTLNEFLDTVFEAKGTAGAPDNLIIDRIIDAGTHLNLSHINHNFVELTSYDKHDQFLEIMGDISANKMDNETAIVFCNSVNSCRSTEYLLRENGKKFRKMETIEWIELVTQLSSVFFKISKTAKKAKNLIFSQF